MLSFRQFLRQRLDEGNPLSRMHSLEKQGRHFIAISAARPNQTPNEESAKMNELESHFRDHGFGIRKAKGSYEGVSEPSLIVHAKDKGDTAGKHLVAFARSAAKKYDQDSILHHDGKAARLIGTNETGFPGLDKSAVVGGKLRYNRPKAKSQTELRPGSRFTTYVRNEK